MTNRDNGELNLVHILSPPAALLCLHELVCIFILLSLGINYVCLSSDTNNVLVSTHRFDLIG